MDAQPDDVTTTDDLTLMRAARAGDRLAFGVLYLRHHAAAWRVACVVSRFSPDAELAVIEGFTRVFSALPEEPEEFGTGGVTFRPYVLACVRQAALDRARTAGRVQTPDGPPAVLAGLGPEGEVVLSSLEHHVSRGALAALPERSRTALWLFDVEAMTPGEVAGILGGTAAEMPVLAAGARREIHAAQQTALGRQEVRSDCRFTVDHLDAYQTGTLDPTKGLIVRAHLGECPPCRMRQGELANAPAALAAAVPAAPLLGGEAQHHWRVSAADIRPAERVLPPVLAAGGVIPRPPLSRRTASRLGTAAGAAMVPARRLPDAVRRAGRAAAGSWRSQADSIDLTTRSTRPRSATSAGVPGAPDPTTPPGWTGSPGWSGSPAPSLPPAWTFPPGRTTAGRADRRASRRQARRALAAGGLLVTTGRRPALAGHRPEPAAVLVPARAAHSARPVLQVVTLAVAWVLVMMALPHLITPGTAPGPGGLALPAVQAYVPGYAPGAAITDDDADSVAAATVTGTTSGRASGGSAGTELAALPTAEPGRATAASAGTGNLDGPSIGLISTAASGPARSARLSRPRVKPPTVPTPGAIVPAVVTSVVPATVAAATTAIAPLTLTPVAVTTATNPAKAGKPTAQQPTKADKPKADKPKADKPKADKPKADKRPKPKNQEKAKLEERKTATPLTRLPERPFSKSDQGRTTTGSTRKPAVPRGQIFTA